jgi:enamine deaminase RidA (YjgF/YER057c/UK114 family)
MMGKLAVHPATMHASPGSTLAHVVSGGRLLLFSGQVPRDADRNLIGEGDFSAQAHQVFANIRTLLEACDAGFGDVVRYTTYLTSPSFVTPFREIRLQYFVEPYPSNTLVIVPGLASVEYFIEIEVTAFVEDGR